MVEGERGGGERDERIADEGFARWLYIRIDNGQHVDT
jgi:hypothetical protein